MEGSNRSIFYFNQPGIDNTIRLSRLLYKRLKGRHSKCCCGKSSGATGLKFAKEMARETNR